jgi:hypothetical protein
MDRPNRPHHRRDDHPPEDRERLRLRLAWEHLERAADYLPPGHPAELHLRRALAAVADDWGAVAAPED